MEKENLEISDYLALAKFYRKFGFEERFWQNMHMIRKSHENLAVRDANFYFDLFKIEEEESGFRALYNSFVDDMNLHAAHRNLDVFYSILKMELSCALEIQKKYAYIEDYPLSDLFNNVFNVSFGYVGGCRNENRPKNERFELRHLKFLKIQPMDTKVNEQKLLEIFIWTDDFVKSYDRLFLPAPGGQRRRRPGLTTSEMMTLLIFYHYSGYKCFEYYYQRCVLKDLCDHFPQAPSYNRFVQLIPRCMNLMYLMGQIRGRLAQATGFYFVDSKKLPVCDNRRIHSHKVFKDVAKRGKTSTGWFFGLKIHLIINNIGEIVNFVITAGNVMDNAKGVLDQLFRFIQGKCFGDKGYISKYFEHYYRQGIHLVTRIRKNMKNRPMDWCDKMMLFKRGVIESVNDILMTVFDIDHTRHRSPINAVTHMLGAVLAYSFYDSKPSVFNPAFLNMP